MRTFVVSSKLTAYGAVLLALTLVAMRVLIAVIAWPFTMTLAT